MEAHEVRFVPHITPALGSCLNTTPFTERRDTQMSFYTLHSLAHLLQTIVYSLSRNTSRMVSFTEGIFIRAHHDTLTLGNLRQYIFDKKKPLPWRLRLSFATDIVRAMSYLHARQCIHRDLKPENLLITANGRIKVTDFGFARIVAQTAEETRRLTFCGTDSYMSPEILIGDAFGLETDVYSLGIIFCELAARKLSDDDTFKVRPRFMNAPPYSHILIISVWHPIMLWIPRNFSS